MDEAQVAGWHGRELYDRDGTKIGTIEDAFLDARTDQPAWATVSAGLFGRKHHFVPLVGAREVDGGIAVPVDGRLVGDAPHVDRDGDLSLEDEHRLYEHYGIDDGIGSGAAGPGERADDGQHARDRADDAGRDDDLRGHDDRGAHDDRHDRDVLGHDDRGDDVHGRDDRGHDLRGPDGPDVHGHDAQDDDGHGHGTGVAAATAAGVAAGSGRRDDRDTDVDGRDDVTPAADRRDAMTPDDDLRAQQAAA
ncbi:PRC-barrel domain-containing protein, partial [Patulibacter sp.]|uniref:PRC-barrel domain-containing protein n=1 Tax=Patulibacter sp. TaxID=1912859 RepID=UPI00271F0C36